MKMFFRCSSGTSGPFPRMVFCELPCLPLQRKGVVQTILPRCSCGLWGRILSEKMITGVPQLTSARLPQSVARRWEQFVVPSLTVALDIGMRSSMFVRLQFLPSMIPLPTCVAVIRNATSFLYQRVPSHG